MSLPAAGSSPADTTLHSNVVFIIDATQKITGIQYVANSLVISKGQPSQQPATIVETAGLKSFGIPYNQFTITLEAGRHGTSEVADQFNSGTGGSDHQIGCYVEGFTKSPADLNFFFSVTLNAGDSSCVLYIGQGSNVGSNNWWAGGSSIEFFNSSWSIGSAFTFLGEGMYIVGSETESNYIMLVPFSPKTGAFPDFF